MEDWHYELIGKLYSEESELERWNKIVSAYERGYSCMYKPNNILFVVSISPADWDSVVMNVKKSKSENGGTQMNIIGAWNFVNGRFNENTERGKWADRNNLLSLMKSHRGIFEKAESAVKEAMEEAYTLVYKK